MNSQTEQTEQPEQPGYNIIKEENQYEFIIWCNELKPSTINLDKFNMLLQININEWIYENNVTWQYAYGNIIDTLKSQQDIEKSLQETEEKPSDKIKRRELFAKKAEERKNKN